MAFAIISSVIVFMLLIIAVISLYFYHVAVERSSKAFLADNPDLKQINGLKESKVTSNGADREMTGEQWLEAQQCETWSVTSNDGLKLCACYISAEKPSGKTALLAHGYSSRGSDMGAFARFFRDELGFNVLMPDARGHGKSEGEYIGFGWHERLDCLLWIDQVLERGGEGAQIVLFGISMGAATVMSASGEALVPKVRAIKDDCGYSSLWDELSWQLKRMYRLPPFPFMHVTSLITRLRAGYGFKEASAIEQIKKCCVPMLFIHGADDKFVPVRMAHELYAACPAQKEIFIVDGAGHGMAHAMNTQGYERKVKEFIGRYVT